MMVEGKWRQPGSVLEEQAQNFEEERDLCSSVIDRMTKDGKSFTSGARIPRGQPGNNVLMFAKQ